MPVHSEDPRRLLDPLEDEPGLLGHRQRQAARQERAHDLGDEELASLRVLREARGDDDRGADELPLVRYRLAGVDAGADAHRPVWPGTRVPLRLAEDRGGAAHRGAGRGEDDIEGVALGLHFGTLVLCDLRPYDAPVVGDERGGGDITMPFDERRVVAQIREQERAGGEHARSVAPPRPPA